MKTSKNSSTEATSAASKVKASKVQTTSKPLTPTLVSADLKVETPQAVKAEKEDGWQAAKDRAETAGAQPQSPKAKAKRNAAPKAEKITKKTKAEADADAETGDRLPGNLEELKATKGGLVSFLFVSGKDKEAIAAELKAAFKLGDAQAVKIVRRITGRVRLFQRVFELMAAK